MEEGRVGSAAVLAVARAMQLFARVARQKRLYHPNNEVLVRALKDLDHAFSAMLTQEPLVVLRVRPEAIYIEDAKVLEELDAEEPIPAMLYQEGVRRLEFQEGLTPSELDVLLTAIANSFAFSGVGDDLVSFLWRHELEHIRYLVVEDGMVDASSQQGADSDAASIDRDIGALLRAIYGDNTSDVGLTSIHVDQTDFLAKQIAEQLTEVDELAPGFHPARSLERPKYAQRVRDEVTAETELQLFARVLVSATDALTEAEIEAGDRDAIFGALLRLLDGAMLSGHLLQVVHLIRTVRSLSVHPHLDQPAKAWLAEALSETRVRAAVIARASSPSPEAMSELVELLRGLGRPVLPALLASLGAVPDPLRRRALSDLALELGIDDTQPVIGLLKEGQSHIAAEGVYILSKLKGGVALIVGKRLIDDLSSDQRAVGFQLLGATGDPKAEEIVFERVQKVDFDQQPLPVKRGLLDAYARLARQRATGFLVRKITKATSDHVADEIIDSAVLATEALRLIEGHSTNLAVERAHAMRSHRVREAAERVGRWLERGENPDSAVSAVSAVTAQMSAVLASGLIPNWESHRRLTSDTTHRRDNRGRTGSRVQEGQGSPAQGRSISPKVVELGRSFLSALFMGVRTAQIHEPTNRAFENALNILREAAEALFLGTGGFSIQLAEDSAFLNGAHIRLGGRSSEGLKTLKTILEQRGLGGIQVRSAPTYDGLRRLLLVFARPPDETSERAKEDLSALQIELLGPQHLKDLPDAELAVDRRAFALHSYGKLLLALREQRERANEPPGTAAEGGKRPRLRAVRVIQELIELAADRLDLLLRLGSNRRGAPLEELHSVNTCILAIAMGQVLGLSRQDLVEIGVAALFHDLGRLVGTPRGQFATKAFARLLTVGGAQASTLLRAVVVGELSMDPSAPSKLGLRRPPRHPYTRMVEVAKAYDALCSGVGTPDGRPVHALDALAALVASRSELIDPHFGDLLVNVLRAFPRGMRVILDNGELAQVKTQVASSRWDRPLVLVESGMGRVLDLMEREGERFLLRIVETVPPGGEGFMRPELEAWRAAVAGGNFVEAEITLPAVSDETPTRRKSSAAARRRPSGSLPPTPDLGRPRRPGSGSLPPTSDLGPKKKSDSGSLPPTPDLRPGRQKSSSAPSRPPSPAAGAPKRATLDSLAPPTPDLGPPRWLGSVPEMARVAGRSSHEPHPKVRKPSVPDANGVERPLWQDLLPPRSTTDDLIVPRAKDVEDPEREVTTEDVVGSPPRGPVSDKRPAVGYEALLPPKRTSLVAPDAPALASLPQASVTPVLPISPWIPPPANASNLAHAPLGSTAKEITPPPKKLVELGDDPQLGVLPGAPRSAANRPPSRPLPAFVPPGSRPQPSAPAAQKTTAGQRETGATALPIPRALSSRMRLSLDDATVLLDGPKRPSLDTAASGPTQPANLPSPPSQGPGAERRPSVAQAPGSAYQRARELRRTLDSVEYAARVVATGESVKLKVLDTRELHDPRMAPAEWRVLFEREAMLAAGSRHSVLPHLVGTEAIRATFALAYQDVQATPLRERLRALEPPALARVFARVAEALFDMHQRGLVHCNPTLENIWLRSDGAPYMPDFSFAAPFAGPFHPLQTANPRCASPEMSQSGTHTPASDQFVLGVALYEALASWPPFGADARTPQRVVRELMPALSHTVPHPLAAVVRRMLEKDPARRFPTCAEVARALANLF